MTESIAQRLIEAAEDWMSAFINRNGRREIDASREAFKQLAQEVEASINDYEFERNKYIANYADNLKRESLWVRLDKLYRQFDKEEQIDKVRKELGLEV
jgi:hypothetical protein